MTSRNQIGSKMFLEHAQHLFFLAFIDDKLTGFFFSFRFTCIDNSVGSIFAVVGEATEWTQPGEAVRLWWDFRLYALADEEIRSTIKQTPMSIARISVSLQLDYSRINQIEQLWLISGFTVPLYFLTRSWNSPCISKLWWTCQTKKNVDQYHQIG